MSRPVINNNNNNNNNNITILISQYTKEKDHLHILYFI